MGALSGAVITLLVLPLAKFAARSAWGEWLGWLFFSGGFLTWLTFGDSVTAAQFFFYAVLFSAAINTLLGAMAGCLLGAALHWRLKFSLRSLLIATTAICAAIALPAWAWLAIVPAMAYLAAYVAAVSRLSTTSASSDVAQHES
jgi:hypothetical protein